MVRVGLVGLVIGALLLTAVLVGNNGDPAVLLAIGSETPSREFTEDLIGRNVATRGSVGHDGRFFFAQAVNPLYIGDISNARYMDLELYRGQRMFFPLLIGLGGLAPAPAIPWLIAVVNIAAYGLGTAATTRLAEQAGGRAWWGLAFPFNAALLMSVLIGGAGVLALACVLAGTAALGDRRTRTAAILLTLGVMSREVMLLYVVGVVAYEWWRTRKPPLLLAAVPLVTYASWYGYMLIRLDYASPYEGNGGLSFPFDGLISAASTWGDDPASMLTAGITLTICVLLVRQTWRDPSPLVAGSVGFVALALLLSDLVWKNAFDISRALAPIYTAFIVSTFARPETEPVDEPAQDLRLLA